MIDTHCHIDDPLYAPDFRSFIAAQQAGGVEAILVPGIDAASITSVRDTCSLCPGYLFPALGLHPENVQDDYRDQLARLHDALLAHNDWIAIGEIGLDYHFDTTYKTQQQEALRIQLQWAVDHDLPVMIHSRDATEDCLTILREFTGLRGVMHCFSGSRETALQITDMGLYLGIGGVITFKNCRLAEHLASIDPHFLLLETDAPYMAPVPHRGQRNESRWMRYVADILAQVYDTTFDSIDQITTDNAKRLFQLK